MKVISDNSSYSSQLNFKVKLSYHTLSIMASNGNKEITHEVSISQQFYAEMARIVGSVGEYLIFDGQDEAISYLRDSDCLFYKDEEDLQEQVKKNYNVGDIYSQDDITEWVKENVAIEDVFDEEEINEYVRSNVAIEDVFDDEDITNYAVENNSVSIFSEDEIVEWVQENCEIGDVFDDDAIKKAYMSKVVKGAEFFEEAIQGNGKFMTLLTPEQVQEKNTLIETLKTENEALKAKVAEMERATSDLQLLKNIFGDLIFNHRTAKDGQVWKFNADAGKGEWC